MHFGRFLAAQKHMFFGQLSQLRVFGFGFLEDGVPIFMEYAERETMFLS
jgi:hypothetical protein